MLRFASAFMVVTLLVALTQAAPVPVHLFKSAPLYFPTKVGTKWVYSVNGQEETHRITETKRQNDDMLVSIDKAGRNSTWLVSTSGLSLASQTRRQFVRPIPFLKLPHKDGETWEAACRTEEEAMGVFGEPTITVRAHGPEEVTVRAGKFSAVRIEVTYVGDQKAIFWFAPGIGEVKVTGLGDRRQELVSFGLGKD